MPLFSSVYFLKFMIDVFHSDTSAYLLTTFFQAQICVRPFVSDIGRTKALYCGFHEKNQ